MTHCCFLLAILLWLFIPPDVHAQNALVKIDSMATNNKVTSLYRESVKDDSFLDEGREYIGFTNYIDGHSFFESDTWENGSIIYKGQLYNDVPLLYDLVDEEVVVRQYSTSFKIKLFKEEVEYFHLLNHHFVRIEASDVKGSPMEIGFYDRLYGGKNQVLVKRKKKLEEKIEGTDLTRKFVQENKVYILKDGEYYPVRSKRSVLKVLKDRKKEIRRFLKKEKIRFGKDPEDAISKMVKYYDQANPQL